MSWRDAPIVPDEAPEPRWKSAPVVNEAAPAAEAAAPAPPDHVPGPIEAAGSAAWKKGATLGDAWNVVRPFQLTSIPEGAPQKPGESDKAAALRGANEGFDYLRSPEGMKRTMTLAGFSVPGADASVAPSAPGISQAMKDYAGGAAYRQMGGSKITIKSPLSGSGVLGGEARARQAALDMQDLGVLKPLTRPREALERIQVQKHVVGNDLGSVLPALDQKVAAAGRAGDPSVTVDVGDVLGRVQREIIDPLRNSGVQGLKKAADDVEAQALQLANVAPSGQMPLARAHQFRRDLDSSLFHNDKNPLTSTISNAKMYGLRDILDEELGAKVDAAGKAVSGGTEGGEWARLNSLYSSLKTAEKAAAQGARSESGNASIGLRDVTMAAGGLASGNPAAALEAAAAMKLGRTYGPGLSAFVARKASSLADRLPRLTPPGTGSSAAAFAAQTPGAGGLSFSLGVPAAAGTPPAGSSGAPPPGSAGSTSSHQDTTGGTPGRPSITGGDQDGAEHFQRWMRDPAYQDAMRGGR